MRDEKEERSKQGIHVCTCMYMYMKSVPIYVIVHVQEAHFSLFFLWKSDCLGCAVLLCLVCLFDLACFFFSSFSSLVKTFLSRCP